MSENLKGRVKNYSEESYKIDSISGKPGKKDSLTTKEEYNEKGYTTAYYTVDSAGKEHLRQTITRNDNGTVKEFANLNNGKQSMKIVTEMDKDGNYAGAKTYDSTGKQDGYYKNLKANEYGTVYAGKLYKMDDKIKNTFDGEYDKTHQLSSTTTDSTGKTSYKMTMKWNDKGEPAEITEMDFSKKAAGTTTITTFKYETYDSTGNWTQRTSYEKGNPTRVTKRMFVYY